eukprot:CAMPEP_0204185604 /NCGR_PEP_ID=MMETSP0361-20130328/55443_1 /ASSEMBLY_ACC=CAM_ASM_000343 /TAXON_ID=268821 /ORGANISM="Scrippsiella Hangoei, Strain SHTV-5" /LENGTH=51 /DNA_ID=CAMNT_0051145811 /DNA_START=131 /DNA_END=283 /DNA_ORIENTATION=-
MGAPSASAPALQASRLCDPLGSRGTWQGVVAIAIARVSSGCAGVVPAAVEA